jgi:hypothetical protein
MSSSPCSCDQSFVRHRADLVERRPVRDHDRLGRRTPVPMHVDERVCDHDHRGRSSGTPLLPGTDQACHDGERPGELAAGEGPDRHGLHVLVPQHPRDAAQVQHEGEDHQRRDRHVGCHHHVRLGPTYLTDELDPEPKLLHQPLAEAHLRDHDADPDRVEPDRLPRLGLQVPLARGVGRAVRVGDVVTAPRQLAAQLDLEGVAAVVVQQDPHLGRISPATA